MISLLSNNKSIRCRRLMQQSDGEDARPEGDVLWLEYHAELGARKRQLLKEKERLHDELKRKEEALQRSASTSVDSSTLCVMSTPSSVGVNLESKNSNHAATPSPTDPTGQSSSSTASPTVTQPRSLCSNPKCTKDGGLICTQCRHVRYCSAECQKAHWKSHKPNCGQRTAGSAAPPHTPPAASSSEPSVQLMSCTACDKFYIRDVNLQLPDSLYCSLACARRPCSGCKFVDTYADFSDKQLKKGSKRRLCRYCTTANQEASTARPLKDQRPCWYHSHCGAMAKFKCSHCPAVYCTKECLAIHFLSADGRPCYAWSQRPTIEFPVEDRLTDEDINIHFPRLLQRSAQLVNQAMNSSYEFKKDETVLLHTVTRDHLVTAKMMYTVCEGMNWWYPPSSPLDKCIQLIGQWISAIGYATAIVETAAKRIVSQQTVTVGSTSRSVDSMWDDSSRLIHKLLVHHIHYTRVTSHIPTTYRKYHNVDLDEYGTFAHTEIITASKAHRPCAEVNGIAYFQYQPPVGGKAYLVPMVWRMMDPDSSENSVAFTSHAGGLRCMLIIEREIVKESGLVVFGPRYLNAGTRDVVTRSTYVSLIYSGYVPGDYNKSFMQSPYEGADPDFELLDMENGLQPFLAHMDRLRTLAGPNASGDELVEMAEQEKRQKQLEKENDPATHFARLLKRTLNDDWPKHYQMSFVAIPRPGSVESDLLELLFLQELQQLRLTQSADKSSATTVSSAVDASLVVISQIENDTGEDLESMLADRRARMKEMIEQQNSAVAKLSNRSPKSDVVVSVPSPAVSSSSSFAAIVPSTGGSLSSDTSTASATEEWSRAPDWVQKCKTLDVLLTEGSMKFEKFIKFAIRLLEELDITFRMQQAGSHVNFHVDGAKGHTVVNQHAGGGKDNSMNRSLPAKFVEWALEVAVKASVASSSATSPVASP